MKKAAIPSNTLRLAGLDALRGLAVLLMITQHVTFWISSEPSFGWVIQTTGALGGLAAPLFVTLSGVGAVLMAERRSAVDRLLCIRGVLIIGFGYLMNLLTPHWFSPGSWYVLHMIGAALLLAPWLRRLPERGLILAMVAILTATGLLQSYLGMPFRLFNEHMGAPVGLAGIVRYALVDGFFPVFPWLSFFIAGLLAGRWLSGGRPEKILRFGALLTGMGVILSAVYFTGADFVHSEPWVRYFRLQSSFYAALAPLSLMLSGAALLLIVVFSALHKKVTLRSSNVLVCLGRASLTFLIVHVAVIRESAVFFDFWKILPAFPTFLVTAAVLLFFSLAAVAWRRIDYKYGFEWLLRRFD
jgi:uncharacterized membrane protein